MNGIEQAFPYYRYLSQHKAHRKLKSIVTARRRRATMKLAKIFPRQLSHVTATLVLIHAPIPYSFLATGSITFAALRIHSTQSQEKRF